MANFQALKAAIQAAIRNNGNREITGTLLQEILLSMVTTMGDGAINSNTEDILLLQQAVQILNNRLADGYVFAGIATPSTEPISSMKKVFYIAFERGEYSYFFQNGDIPIVFRNDGFYILYGFGEDDDWGIWTLFEVDDYPSVGSNNPANSSGVAALVGGVADDVAALFKNLAIRNVYGWEETDASDSVDLAVKNAVCPRNDRQHSGVLLSWDFFEPLPENEIINIYILKKRRNSSNTVVALDAVREPIAITLSSGASSVDLSGYRIFFGKDYVFGFESPSRDFFTNMKRNDIGQDDSYAYWAASSLDDSFYKTVYNVTFNFNLRIGDVAEEYNYGVLGLQKFSISDSDTKSPVRTFDWTNWAVMSQDDDFEDDVLVDSLRFSTVFTASGLTKVALFEKIKTGSVVTSLRLVCCVNVPYRSGDNELDLKPYKLILKKNYCFGFFTKSTGISYKFSESNFPSWDFWTLSSANGTPSKTNFVLNMNFDIMVVKAISTDIQEYASKRAERLYEWNEFTATRTVELALNNAIVPKKDQEFAGILKRWVFDLPLPTTQQVYIYILRKVKDGSGNIVGLKRISNPIPVSLVQGQKIVDLSGYNIYFDKDYVFGFSSPTESFYSNLKFLNLGTDDAFTLWISRSETEDCESTEINLIFNFNIEIEYITYGNEKEIFSNIALLGDSLTWQGIDNPKIGWFNYLSSKFADFAKLLIYARSGATWSNTPQTVYNITENTGSLSVNNVIFNQMNRLIKDYQDGKVAAPSAIIIFAGTNDALHPSARPYALRDTADDVFADISTDYRTGHNINTCLSIAMAYRYVFEMIIEHFPDAQVVIMSPMQSTGFTKERGDAIGTILRDCAGHTSSIFINMANEAGVSRIVETRKGNYLTRDGIHLIQKGAEMVGDFLAHRLISVLR